MSIQQNVNTSLSLAAFGMSQIPYFKEKAALRVETREAKKLSEKYEKLAETGKEPETVGEAKAQQKIAEIGQKAAAKEFELNPTEKTLTGLERAEQDVFNLARQTAQLEGHRTYKMKTAKMPKKAAKPAYDPNAWRASIDARKATKPMGSPWTQDQAAAQANNAVAENRARFKNSNSLLKMKEELLNKDKDFQKTLDRLNARKKELEAKK